MEGNLPHPVNPQYSSERPLYLPVGVNEDGMSVVRFSLALALHRAAQLAGGSKHPASQLCTHQISRVILVACRSSLGSASISATSPSFQAKTWKVDIGVMSSLQPRPQVRKASDTCDSDGEVGS